MKLLIKGIGQLVTVTEGSKFLAGNDMSSIKVREGCLAVAVDDAGKIAMVGSEKEVRLRLGYENLETYHG